MRCYVLKLFLGENKDHKAFQLKVILSTKSQFTYCYMVCTKVWKASTEFSVIVLTVVERKQFFKDYKFGRGSQVV